MYFGRHIQKVGGIAATVMPMVLMTVSLERPSFSQVVSASLTGTITDSSGGSVPNATVKATERSTGTVRTSSTSRDGVYTITYLNPGNYLVDVEAAGFKKFAQDNVRLDVSSTFRLDATLTPGNASETVTITAEAAALKTDGL